MPLAGDAWHKPPEDASIERLIKTLDEHGVLFGVIAAASLYGDYNDYIAPRDAHAQAPARHRDRPARRSTSTRSSR